MSIIGERRKYFKKEARFFLKYNYLKQIFMTAVVILITFGLNAIKANVINMLGLNYGIYSIPFGIFFDLLAFFITIPMYIGIIYVNIKLFEGETVSISGMFYYFSSSANLIDCYKFIISMAARISAFAVPFLVFGAILSKLRELFEIILYADSMVSISISIDIVMVCVCVIYIAAFFSCVVFFMRYFAAAFIFVKNPCLNMSDIIQKSVRLMKKRKIEAFKLSLSFIFWILISHYLAGFLYVFFTLPYIMLSYTSFLSYLLAEKGGEEFLSAAGDYIDEIVGSNSVDNTQTDYDGQVQIFDILKKINNTLEDINKAEKTDKYDSAEKTGEFNINYDKYLNEDNVYDEDDEDDENFEDFENYEIDESDENNKKIFGFLRKFKKM